MRGVFIAALVALAGTFVFVGSKPATAMPAKAAINYSHTNADLVEVKRWYKKRWRRRYYRPYYYRRPYYRPYRYRPYRYYRPYYRPYYWRRPGVSIWLGW